MQFTYELRWFFDAPPPEFIAFQGECSERTDWYAPIVNGRSSVKLREGRLETKHLLDEQPTALPACAPRQRWCKVSVPLPPADAPTLADVARDSWLPIHKRRRVAWVGSGPSASPVQVEWTLVTAHQTRAWTLAFEGASNQDPQQIVRVVQQVIGQLELDASTLRRPLSYPGWIAALPVNHCSVAAPGHENP